VTRISTYENLENLSPVFRDVVIPRYEGTTLGRQELHAELIETVEGAIFDYDIIARYRSEPPVLERLSIGVDPATTAEKTSDECGIVVGGVATVDTPETPLEGSEIPDRSHLLRHAWVLQDASGRMAVDVWASRTVDLAITWGAGRIVAEVNNGGDLVLSNIKAECEKRGGRATRVRRRRPDGTESGWDWAIELPDGAAFVVAGVWAKDSKALRAEPHAIRYRQGRVHHAETFVELEAEQTTWVPGQESPNRLDALVWALTDLLGMEVKKKARLRFRE
jgi:phage terminase large subunit-like protein